MNWLRLIALLVIVLALVACGGKAEPTSTEFQSPVSTPGIANPASTNCVEKGYQLEIRDEAGGQVGYCIFPDGTECGEWAYYRGECAPGTPKP